MAKFKYVAIKKDGSTVNGQLDAVSRSAALQLIQGQGLKLVDLREAGDKKKRAPWGRQEKRRADRRTRGFYAAAQYDGICWCADLAVTERHGAACRKRTFS